MPKLKIAIASFLLLLFVLLTARFSLFTVLMDLQKSTSRVEAIQALQVKTLRVKAGNITQNKTKVEWRENGKEICVDGKMYEVIARKNVKGDVLLYVMADTKETALYGAFAGLDDQQQKNCKDVFHLFSAIGLYLSLGYLLICVYREGLEMLFSNFYLKELRGKSLELVKPPSKC
jgi:hypothetical protein